jgi:hypothetical protein
MFEMNLVHRFHLYISNTNEIKVNAIINLTHVMNIMFIMKVNIDNN